MIGKKCGDENIFLLLSLYAFHFRGSSTSRTIEPGRLSVIWSGAQGLMFSHIILDNKRQIKRERYVKASATMINEKFYGCMIWIIFFLLLSWSHLLLDVSNRKHKRIFFKNVCLVMWKERRLVFASANGLWVGPTVFLWLFVMSFCCGLFKVLIKISLGFSQEISQREDIWGCF